MTLAYAPATAPAQNLIQSYLAAVNHPLLARLDSLPGGAHVVDLGCGPGEPVLALAHRRPDLRITGIDTDDALLDTARVRAARDRLGMVDFRRMSMAELEFHDDGIDGIVSRGGLLTPGLVRAGATLAEAARVLRPGGVLSVATWGAVGSNPGTGVALPVLRHVLRDGAVADFEARYAELTRDSAFEDHLADADFTRIDATWFSWETECPDFETWWQLESGAGPYKPLFDRLDEHERTVARQTMADVIGEYETAFGSYLMPATCRIVTAERGRGRR